MLYRKIQVVAWMIGNAGLIILASRLVTGSANPIESFTGHGVLPKLVLGFLILMQAASVRALFVVIGTRRAACPRLIPEPACGTPVFDPQPREEMRPGRCRFCRRWYHLRCLEANGGSFDKGCLQPHCPSSGRELHLLLQNAVSTIDGAQRDLDHRDLNKYERGLASLERGFAELDRAFKFESRLAGQNLAFRPFSSPEIGDARRYHEEAALRLRWARFEYGGLKAGEAMGREDWSGAINWLGTTIRNVEGGAFPNELLSVRERHAHLHELRESLAFCHTKLAINNSERIIENTARAIEAMSETLANTSAVQKLLADLNSAQRDLSRATGFGPLDSGILERLAETNEELLRQIRAIEPGVSRAETRGSSAAPWGIVDRVDFTVTSPPSVMCGTPFVVDVWAHTGPEREVVIQRARESVAAGSEIIFASKGPVKIVRGSALTVRLKIEDLVVEYPEDTILWEGEIGNAKFLVRVPNRASEGPKSGSATIHLDGFQLARVSFVIHVGKASTPVDWVPAGQQIHRKAFASYARADSHEVLSRIQGIQKAAPSLQFFFDRLSLRSGQDWEKELRSVIGSSDVFYLFWSDNARKSEWVEKEWRCALDTRGIDFIDPVPLVSPDEAPPPPELASKHFNDWVLAFMSSERASS